MNRTLKGLFAAIAGVVVAVSLPATSSAAPTKPGIYAPATAVVGQKVVVTTVFKVKDNGSCFFPDIDWGDPNNLTSSFTFCGKTRKGSGRFSLKTSKFDFVYEAPGTYTITVTAAAEKNGQTSGKNAIVSGARKYTKTIVITGSTTEPTP